MTDNKNDNVEIGRLNAKSQIVGLFSKGVDKIREVGNRAVEVGNKAVEGIKGAGGTVKDLFVSGTKKIEHLIEEDVDKEVKPWNWEVRFLTMIRSESLYDVFIKYSLGE